MTERVQPLLDLIEQQGYTLPELLLVCTSLAAPAVTPAPQRDEATPGWLRISAFAEARGISLHAARHMARDERFAPAFRHVAGRLYGNSERLDSLISVSAPTSTARPESVSRPRGPRSKTTPAKAGRRRQA